jgi:hypothetical protein
MAKQRHWTFWFFSVLFTWVVLVLIYGSKNTQFMLELYDQAATTMWNGSSPDGVAAMAYPPLLVASYLPFIDLTEYVQRIAVLGAMACFLVFIFSTLQTMVVGKHSFKQNALFWILVGAIVGRYVVSPIENYSHDLLIGFFVVLAIRCWATQKEGAGGVAMGIAAACKATPLLFLPFLLLQRRWKSGAVMAVVTVVAFLVPDILFPRADSSWAGYWFSVVTNSLHVTDGKNAVQHWSTWNQLNQSLSGTIERLFSFPEHPDKDAVDVRITTLTSGTISIITLFARAMILGAVCIAFLQPSKAPVVFRRFCEGALLVSAMLLLSPMSSKAHFFLLLLPAVVMVRTYIWEKRDWVLTIIFISMFVYGTLTVKDLIGTDAGHAVLATGSVTWCTLLAMLGTWRVMRLSKNMPQESSSVSS